MAKRRTPSAADREVIAACVAAGLNPPPTVHVLDRLRYAGCLPPRYLPDGVGRGLGRGRGTRPGCNPSGYIDQAVAAARLVSRRQGQGERISLRFAPAVLFHRGYPIAEHPLKESYRAILDARVEQPLEKAARELDTAELNGEDARLDQVDAFTQLASKRPTGLRKVMHDDVRKAGGSKGDFQGQVMTLFSAALAGHPPTEPAESASLFENLGLGGISGCRPEQFAKAVAEWITAFRVRLETMTVAELEQGRENLGLLLTFLAAVNARAEPDMGTAVVDKVAADPVEAALLVPVLASANWTHEQRLGLQQMLDVLAEAEKR